MSRPLVVDIDGTMSRADRSIEGRVLDALHEWPAPVVVATGKAFPYPVALCDYVGIDTNVIAENGGVVYAAGSIDRHGDLDAARRVETELRERGYDLGWDETDLINRWRETELAVRRHVPRDVLESIAADHGLEVVDSGFAFHVKSPDVSKGLALETVAGLLDRRPADFVAIGDSENDVSTFAVAGVSYAVANADGAAREAADYVAEGAYADGLLEALADVD